MLEVAVSTLQMSVFPCYSEIIFIFIMLCFHSVCLYFPLRPFQNKEHEEPVTLCKEIQFCVEPALRKASP